MNILITGCAGFIGFHLSEFLLKKYKKSKIIGFDNINNFYSPILKKMRIKELKKKISSYVAQDKKKKRPYLANIWNFQKFSHILQKWNLSQRFLFYL